MPYLRVFKPKLNSVRAGKQTNKLDCSQIWPQGAVVQISKITRKCLKVRGCDWSCPYWKVQQRDDCHKQELHCHQGQRVCISLEGYTNEVSAEGNGWGCLQMNFSQDNVLNRQRNRNKDVYLWKPIGWWRSQNRAARGGIIYEEARVAGGT